MPLNLVKKANKAKCYTEIAAIYDYLMRHVNYQRWYEYLSGIFNVYMLHQNRILEMACGTGILLEKFVKDGWEAYGFDYSREMVSVAKNRLHQSQIDPAIWVGDMRRFGLKKPVDAVICLYDSMNYCLHEKELLAAFNCVFCALKENGLFVFDVVTLKNCQRNFRNYYEKDSFKHIDFIRQAHFDAKRKYQINEFYMTLYNDGFRRCYEQHIQRIYRLEDVQNLLKKFQWQIVGRFDNFSRQPGTEKSDRVHFVVRKS